MVKTFFIAILIIILLYCLYILLYNKKYGEIIFLTKNNFDKNIFSDYINKFSKYEIKFKTNNKNLNNEHQKLLNYYYNKIEKFTKKEKLLIINHIVYINKIAPKFITNTDWKFVKLSADIEKGMPFTLDKFIFFSNKFLNKLHYEKNFMENCDTIIHEKLHIIQRFNNKIFNTFYKNALGAIHTKNILISNYWKKFNLKNPDGLDIGWIYEYNNKYYLPMLLFDDNNNKVNQIVIKLKKNGKYFITTKSYQDIYSFKAFKIYPKIISLYHPNEISAYIIPKIILKSYKFNKNIINKFNNFINNDLKNIYI